VELKRIWKEYLLIAHELQKYKMENYTKWRFFWVKDGMLKHEIACPVRAFAKTIDFILAIEPSRQVPEIANYRMKISSASKPTIILT
jgi:hypothetical protein